MVLNIQTQLHIDALFGTISTSNIKINLLFLNSWFDNNIILATQLLNDNGNLLNYYEFLQTYGVPVTPNKFAIVMDAVPSGILTEVLESHFVFL